MSRAIIREEDYDFYSISLPFRIAFSGRRKNFLSREIEKRHPRFSALSCVHSRFSLKKGKLQADVAVMDKNVLAAYQKKFPGKKLFLEKNGKGSVFGENHRNVVISAALVLVSLFFGSMVLNEILRQHKKVSAAQEILLQKEDSVCKETAALPVLLAPQELISAVFASISKKGGRLTSFSWNNGNCSFSIEGCNSEDIVQAQYCVVSYRDNRPYFVLSVPVAELKFQKNSDFPENSVPSEMLLSGIDFSKKDGGEKLLYRLRANGTVEMLESSQSEETASVKNAEGADYRKSVEKVRKELFALGAAVEMEHVREDEAEFAFSASDSIFYSALKICGTEAKKLGWQEKSFSVEKNGKTNHVKVVFDRSSEGFDISENFSPTLLTATYAWLFKEEELLLEPKPVKIPAVFARTAQIGRLAKNAGLQSQKLGEIRRRDGSVLTYFRNLDGKIAYEKLESANEN